MKRPFDIVAFQDPPKTILWTKTVGYELWFESERGLTEDDHPRLVGRDEQANDNLPAGRRVGFLVSKTIAKSALDFAYARNAANRDKVATLHYKAPCGTRIHITNAYNVEPGNPDRGVDLNALADGLSGDGYDMVLGDFNLHLHRVSRLADSRTGVHRTEAILLEGLMLERDMALITPPWMKTFTRSDRADEPGSTIDLAWTGPILAQIKSRESWIERKPFESDHRLIDHQFDLRVEREPVVTQRWSSVDRDKFRAEVLRRLEETWDATLPGYEATHLPGKKDLASRIDKGAELIDEAINMATKLHVKARTLSPVYEAVRSPELLLARKLDVQARAEYEMDPNPLTRQCWSRCDKQLRRAELVEQARRRGRYRRFVASRRRTPFQLSKMARTRHQPRVLPHMGGLRRDPDDEKPTFVTPKDKTKFLAQTIWTPEGVGDEETTECVTASRYRPTRCTPISFECQVTPDDVKGVMTKLRKRKACGKSGVKNEALRLLAAVGDEELEFERYLADLFTACLVSGYFADCWRVAKPGKGRYVPCSQDEILASRVPTGDFICTTAVRFTA